MSTPFDEVFADLHIDPPDPIKLDLGEVFDHPVEPVHGARVTPGHHEPRFNGDTSELPPEVCWTMQALVAAPYVGEKDRKHWSCVLQYEDVLRSRLSELGLILTINQEHRYAFAEQADDPSPHSRTVLRTRTLSLAASALALYLYQQYLTAPDDPVVTARDITDHMLAYKRPEDTDEGAFHKKVRSAITALCDAGIIRKIPATNRYVIYSVITSILTSDRVQALEERYRAIARTEPLQDIDIDPDRDDNEDDDDV
ncbi:DUF4194 domain-containing protein [Nocardia testacea]|uniref:DUF4194 domain-containing protein n=1 Tax=Nocardia testacea TaxID=248551 RepID=UPI003C300EDD